jgi:hypothetical protein
VFESSTVSLLLASLGVSFFFVEKDATDIPPPPSKKCLLRLILPYYYFVGLTESREEEGGGDVTHRIGLRVEKGKYTTQIQLAFCAVVPLCRVGY